MHDLATRVPNLSFNVVLRVQKQLEVSEQDAKAFIEEHFLEPPSRLCAA